jgi:eIF-2B alpha/beta/delta-like uncharacterized protein
MVKSVFKKKTIDIIKDIEDLKVQGASNVAFSSQDVLIYEFENYDKTKNELLKYFFDLCKALWKTRPTEPAMKHFLTSTYLELEKFARNRQLGIIKTHMSRFVKGYKENQKENIKKIGKIAKDWNVHSKLVVFTHCHSSIVENAIKELNRAGKLEFVVNTETRPLFQGRTTSKNLAKAGIKVNHIVDSCAYAYARLLKQRGKNIVFFTGADVITRKGELVNKIGTSQISFCMHHLGINHYVFTFTNKIDPVSKNWDLEDIEIRSPKEIWNEHNKNIFVHNYAFDITPEYLVKKIVTEKGIIEPKDLIKHNNLKKREIEIWKDFEK